MKLDNIIYDVDSLALAISEQWNADSSTFKAMYPSDTATSLVNGFASYGAMLQYMLTSVLANCYTPTAFSTTAVYQLANTLGNNLHGNSSAQVRVNITKTNFIGINTVIPAETQFEIDGKKFFNPSAIIIPANNATVNNIVLIQGEMLEVNRISSGISNEKFYFSSDFKANHNYITVKINGRPATVAESFLAYDKNYILDASEMNTVVLVTDPDGRSYIKVGNNQLANLPASGSTIQIKYVSNEGSDGNIPEIGAEVSLLTPLVFSDNFGIQDNLQLDITTITTAYGGFSKQSVDTLRLTSPQVFASGHRAIRRQDYVAMLLNKCGYLTAAVWGEYEEAEKVGAYDALMMNMVYYTGLKSFETYPYFIVGNIVDPTHFENSLNSVRGFWGSFSLRLRNLKNSNSFILIQDTGAEGQLFINNNHDDPRDSLLPDWVNTMEKNYLVSLPSNYISSAGINYSVNDELLLENTNNEITVRVEEIDTMGRVMRLRLLKHTTSKNWLEEHTNPFDTTYINGSQNGTGLTVNIAITTTHSSTLIYTNDDRGINSPDDNSIILPPTQLNPILNARSDQPATVFYQSLWQPSLLQPVQIILNYKDIEKGIAGIKFQATNLANGPFIGTVAMFGTNIEPMPSLENVRNSENWDRLIDRTYLTNPYGNTNENWTDWIPTNAFKGEEDSNKKAIFARYKYFVIEFYSCEENSSFAVPLITFSKIKILYEEDASVIFYNDNGRLDINFPTIGSPGPGENNSKYLTQPLLNTLEYPLYAYEVKLDGITTTNGYRNGNILAYIFTNNDITMPFVVKVINIDNGIFSVSLNDNTILTGTESIDLPTPASLDTSLTYTAILESGGMIALGKGGSGYKPNDIVSLNGTNNELKLRVATVNSYGEVLSVVWMNDLSLTGNYNGEFETTLLSSPTGGNGVGLLVSITSIVNSGENGIPGAGGTISIVSRDNLLLEASFVGNRIDSQNINYLDQPIINQYNHFTTFLEFKQPEIVQVGITIQVNLSPNAAITSGIIIQNIKNNVNSLFSITPNYIGKGLKISDIYKAVMSTPNVEWCHVTAPNANIDIPSHGLLIPTYIDIIEVLTTFK